MELGPGLYELLIDSSIQDLLSTVEQSQIVTKAIDSGESHDILATCLAKQVSAALRLQVGEDKLKKQVEIYNRLIEILSTVEPALRAEINDPPHRLFEIKSTSSKESVRADTPLSQHCILTRTKQDPTLESQLKKEIDSSDEIDILCSFIKWTGLRRIKDNLESFTQLDGSHLRVITTSYMGATDLKAVDTLQQLTNTEVKVSYDHERTRLHAKAFIFKRNSGFGTAYIGSSNISHAALTDGLEWNVKISQYDSPHLWAKLVGSFETHWNGSEFETYTPDCHEKFKAALKTSTNFGDNGVNLPFFDINPYPFQKEILDRIAAERFLGDRTKHLIVAATGTGKTLIAAFDYARFAQNYKGRLPKLLFVAHREEILKQSLATFRAVVKDFNFGELFTRGKRPETAPHVFMSVQTLNSISTNGLGLPSNFYDYIVIDEFHHAAAPSYKALLEHFKPKCLLGLTATPERADGKDILHWFDGHITAQIRLPDAVNRKLLCPFHYFGITDNVDLGDLKWVRGGYDRAGLDDLYLNTHNAKTRVALVLRKLDEYVLDPKGVKALGFCVSIKHAEFMAKSFSAHGYKAIAVTGQTDDNIRSSVRHKLKSGEINYVFTVDLYNEGVDIPEIDTVLFLRPTESLTVFLQQLGRGLRHSIGKECLTVLDLIGQANKKYRFDVRYSALLDDPARHLSGQIGQGFPHLPAGCSIQLERKAQEHILSNIKRSISGSSAGLITALTDFADRIGSVPTLSQFLTEENIGPENIYKFDTCYSRLLVQAQLANEFDDPDLIQLTKGLRRIQHISGPKQIRFLLDVLKNADFDNLTASKTVRDKWLSMAAFSVWGRKGIAPDQSTNFKRLLQNPTLANELGQLLAYRLDSLNISPTELELPYESPLELHAPYTRDELLAGTGYWTLTKQPEKREGVVFIPEIKTDLFFITLNKTEANYSPTTMYEDYAVSDSLFHWQSQSRTSETDPTGKRYINHQLLGSTVLLCVRENSSEGTGLSNPFYFLGPADYVNHTGNRPMSIIWKLRYPMPAKLYRLTATLEAA